MLNEVYSSSSVVFVVFVVVFLVVCVLVVVVVVVADVAHTFRTLSLVLFEATLSLAISTDLCRQGTTVPGFIIDAFS